MSMFEYKPETIKEDSWWSDDEIQVTSRLTEAGAEALERLDTLRAQALDADLSAPGAKFRGVPAMLADTALQGMHYALDRAMDYYDGGISDPAAVPLSVLVDGAVEGLKRDADMVEALSGGKFTTSRELAQALVSRVWREVVGD